MIVYVDVLIFINAVTDYLLINLSSAITGSRIHTLRLALTSLFASFFSLLIFLPYLGIFPEILIRVFSAMLICLMGYGYKSFKLYLKNFFAFLTVSVIFNGLMSVIWVVFKPSGMVVNNSAVYFNISAIETIIFSVASYILIRIVLSIIRRASPYARRCNVKLQNDGRCVEVTGLVDTGNSLKDIYKGRQVIITDESVAVALYGELGDKNKLLLPYTTVGGTGTIAAYPCKDAFINNYKAGPVLVAVTNIPIEGDCKAILNPEIMNIR